MIIIGIEILGQKVHALFLYSSRNITFGRNSEDIIVSTKKYDKITLH